MSLEYSIKAFTQRMRPPTARNIPRPVAFCPRSGITSGEITARRPPNCNRAYIVFTFARRPSPPSEIEIDVDEMLRNVAGLLKWTNQSAVRLLMILCCLTLAIYYYYLFIASGNLR